MKLAVVGLGFASLVAQGASVHGVVLDVVTGKPLQGVHIRLYWQPNLGKAPYGAISDAAGRFSIDSVVASTYTVFTDLPGYLQTTQYNALAVRRQPLVTVTAASSVEELKIELVPAAVIRGRVKDRSGNPVKHAVVQLRDETGGIIQGTEEARGNGLGEYSVVAPPGKYLVMANQDGMSAWMAGDAGRPTAAYVDTYYPNALLEERATVIRLKAGELREQVDIEAAPRNLFSVMGNVAGISNPGCQPSVLLEKRLSGRFLNPRQAAAATDGGFSFIGVEPGLYHVSASCGSKYSSAIREFEIGNSNVTDANLELSENRDWTGRVEMPANETLRGGKVRFRLLTPTFQDPREFPVDDHGNFHVSGLPRRAYRVEVATWSANESVEEMTIDGHAAPNPIDLASVQPSSMTIVVGPSGSLSGVILGKDGKPASGLTCALFVAADPKRIRLEDIKLVDGTHFDVAGLRPGKYRVFAVDAVESGASTLEAWRAIAESAEEVEIARGSIVSVKLTLQDRHPAPPRMEVATPRAASRRGEEQTIDLLRRLSAGLITGRVYDGSGKGIEGILVEAIDSVGRTQSVRSEERGIYRLASLRPGLYKVAVRNAWPYLQPTVVPAEIRTDGSVESQYARRFYPRASSEAAASNVAVKAGEETTGIDINTVSIPVLHIRVRVADQPPADKTVSVQLLKGDRVVFPAIRNNDGTFEFWRIDPGRYRLQTLRANCQGAMAWKDLEVGETSLEEVEVPKPPPIDRNKPCVPVYIN